MFLVEKQDLRPEDLCLRLYVGLPIFSTSLYVAKVFVSYNGELAVEIFFLSYPSTSLWLSKFLTYEMLLLYGPAS